MNIIFKKSINILILGIAFVLTACSSPENNDQEFQYKAQLKPFQSCDELTSYLLETAEKERSLYDYYDTTEVAFPGSPSQSDTVASDSLSIENDSTNSIVDYTSTNNQVSGVDEADFVKTDGDFTYIVSGGYFVIFDNWPAAQARELARIKLAGESADLFIHQDIAWIVSNVYDYDYEQIDNTIDSQLSFVPRVSQHAVVSIFDISERNDPLLIRETTLEGYYLDARRIDNRVFMIVSAYIDFYPLIESKENLQINDLLPVLTDKLYVGDEINESIDLISQCENIFRPGTANGTATLSLINFDLAQPRTEIKRQTIISNSGMVYANDQHLYIATIEDNAWVWLPVIEGDDTPSPGTMIHKFDLTQENPVYLASGRVDGFLINQFAMDEYNNLLRTVTTVSEWWADGIPINSLFILEQSGDELVIRSELTGLGKQGESIYAARFLEDKGFLVTFQQIDPLYTLDLSDPDNPRVAGELEVPGFSTYLHPLEDSLLLALGRNVSNDSIDLSLFDISDFDNPSLLFRESIGDGSYTEAQYSHKAFTWFAQEQIIALPVTRWLENTLNDDFYSYDVFNGLFLYKVNEDSGFEKVGEVDHSEFYSNENELRWYYPENIRRSFFTIDENQNTYLYSISSRGFKVNALPDLETLATLPLPVYEWQDDFLYW